MNYSKHSKMIALGALFVSIVFVALFLNSRIKTRTNHVSEMQTIAMDPPNNSTDVPVHESIRLRVDGPVHSIDTLFPEFENLVVEVVTEENRIIISPQPRWAYGTTYSFEMLGEMFSFTTVGQKTLQNRVEQDDALRLVEQTPFANDMFSVVGDIDPETGTISFSVETPVGVDHQTGIAAFKEWAQQYGLSVETVDELTIEYFESYR